MRIAGKVWGETSLIHANGVLEFHRIAINAGGHCSKHKHDYKWNGFYVENGELVVKVWQNDYDLVDETRLIRGDFMQVKPGLYHSFEATENTIAFELYWAEFAHDDIVRETVGGQTGVVVAGFDQSKSEVAIFNAQTNGKDDVTEFPDGALYNGHGVMIKGPIKKKEGVEKVERHYPHEQGSTV